MNTCRKNWTTLLAQKSEGGAMAKIQCKTGVKTQMCKLCLWKGIDHDVPVWHITKGRKGITVGQEFSHMPKFPLQPHAHAASMLQHVLVYDPEHGRGEAWAPFTLQKSIRRYVLQCTLWMVGARVGKKAVLYDSAPAPCACTQQRCSQHSFRVVPHFLCLAFPDTEHMGKAWLVYFLSV